MTVRRTSSGSKKSRARRAKSKSTSKSKISTKSKPKTRAQLLKDAMATAKKIQSGITKLAPTMTADDRKKISSGLSGVQSEMDKYVKTQDSGTQSRIADIKKQYETKVPQLVEEVIPEETPEVVPQDVPVDETEGEGPGIGGTLDNQITNQMVDAGQLPAEEAELYPQGSQGGLTTQDVGGSLGGTMQATAGTPLSNPSVVDYMDAVGMASDPGSRATLAQALGIPNYTGTAEQNTEMLRQLRNQQAGASTLQQGLSAPISEGSVIQHENYMQRAGVNYTPQDYQADPPRVLSDYITQVMDALGIGEVSVITQKEADELEELENKRDKEMRDVNDNPWLTEGVRLRERAKVEEKYQDEIGNKEAKLARLQRDKELMVQQAQWALGTAISLWDSDRRFDQAQAEALYNRQQDALEWDYKERLFTNSNYQFEQELGLKKQQMSIDWYNAETSRINALDTGGTNGLDATTFRQVTEQALSQESLIGLLTEYKGYIDDYGFTNKYAGDKEILGKITSLHGQITAEYKKAETLGALDAGVIALMESIIGPLPVSGFMIGTNIFGGKSTLLSNQVGSLLENVQGKYNTNRQRLGLPPMVYEQADTYESGSGNTYVLPNLSTSGVTTTKGI